MVSLCKSRSGCLYFLLKRIAVVFSVEKESPWDCPYDVTLSMAVCIMETNVPGSGPEIKRVPSSANPIINMFELSNMLRSSSTTRFHAMGLNTPPWGVPLVRYLRMVEP